jgi:hypothetical protein
MPLAPTAWEKQTTNHPGLITDDSPDTNSPPTQQPSDEGSKVDAAAPKRSRPGRKSRTNRYTESASAIAAAATEVKAQRRSLTDAEATAGDMLKRHASGDAVSAAEFAAAKVAPELAKARLDAVEANLARLRRRAPVVLDLAAAMTSVASTALRVPTTVAPEAPTAVATDTPLPYAVVVQTRAAERSPAGSLAGEVSIHYVRAEIHGSAGADELEQALMKRGVAFAGGTHRSTRSLGEGVKVDEFKMKVAITPDLPVVCEDPAIGSKSTDLGFATALDRRGIGTYSPMKPTTHVRRTVPRTMPTLTVLDVTHENYTRHTVIELKASTFPYNVVGSYRAVVEDVLSTHYTGLALSSGRVTEVKFEGMSPVQVEHLGHGSVSTHDYDICARLVTVSRITEPDPTEYEGATAP